MKVSIELLHELGYYKHPHDKNCYVKYFSYGEINLRFDKNMILLENQSMVIVLATANIVQVNSIYMDFSLDVLKMCRGVIYESN